MQAQSSYLLAPALVKTRKQYLSSQRSQRPPSTASTPISHLIEQHPQKLLSLPIEDMQGFLEKQHDERNAYYEEVATLVVESTGSPDQMSDTTKIIDEDIGKVLAAV